MTPIVATQRTNELDPRFIKLTAEIRAAGFPVGNFRYNRWDDGTFSLRPTQLPSNMRATITKFKHRGIRYQEWCQDLSHRYHLLLEILWNRK